MTEISITQETQNVQDLEFDILNLFVIWKLVLGV
jgi:hypothetical protein